MQRSTAAAGRAVARPPGRLPPRRRLSDRTPTGTPYPAALADRRFRVIIDGAFKRHEEREPLIELAERTDARLLLLEATCDPAEQRRRLESRRQHDTRSDGRVELMEHQRSEFEPPEPAHERFFAEVETDGPKKHTRRRVVELLRAKGLMESEATFAPELST